MKHKQKGVAASKAKSVTDKQSSVRSGGKANGETSKRPAWVFNPDTGALSMQQVYLPKDGICVEISGPLPPGCKQTELFKIEPNGHKFKVGETRTLTGLVDVEEFNGQKVKITAIRKDGERGRAYYIKGKINEKCNWVHEDRLV